MSDIRDIRDEIYAECDEIWRNMVEKTGDLTDDLEHELISMESNCRVLLANQLWWELENEK
jgi:hypothetical protein